MDSKSGGHDPEESSEDKAHGASHDTSLERPNHGMSLLQKISINSEKKLSWIEQIEELEKDGAVINQDKVITSGSGRSTGASEEGRTDPRLIIPRDPSEYPGFPTDMKKFDSPKDFGQAVIMFWAKWRKDKKKSNLHAKKEADRASKMAEKERIEEQNKRVVGANGGGQGHNSRRYRQERRLQNWPRRDGWASGRSRSRARSRERRRDDDRWVDVRRDDDRRDVSRGKTGIEKSKGQTGSQSGARREGGSTSKAGDSDLDTLGFVKPKATDISPELILPIGQDIEVRILRERINQMPIKLLRDKQVIHDCRSASIDEDGKICAKKNLNFWKVFVKDDFGLETFQKTQIEEQKSLKRRLGERNAPLEQQHTLFQRVGKLSNERSALKRPQQQPQQQKKTRQDPVADEFLPFAVYVEKFDENVLVKLTGKEFDTIKAGDINAYWLESFEFKSKLKDGVDRRLFSAERGVATFFAKSELAQDFIIKTINNLVQLPGVKARGPRVESRPNLYVDFPAALGPGILPEVAIKELILMYANIECEPVVRHVKTWAFGRTISVELPADKLAKLAEWGLDNDVDSFSMLSEKLHFWTTFKPDNAVANAVSRRSSSDPLKASEEAIEVIDIDQEMSEAPSMTAADAKLTMVDSAATSAKAATVANPATVKNAPVLPATNVPSSSTVANSAEVATNALASPSVSFKPSGPLEASEEAVETEEDQEMAEEESKETKVESAHLEFKKSLDQSALQLLEDYQSDNDEHMSCINEEEIKSASDESESEDGEVKDEVVNPQPNTSTPIDLAKSLENEKHKARQLARKRLELSPPPSKATDKVCTALNNPDPVLVPALVPALEQEVQPASDREAAGTVTKAERPRRSCTINSYYTHHLEQLE
jgi:hypothetical protein